MVGGGRKKDDAPSGISNNNVFAALETLRKKKKTDGSKSKAGARKEIKEPEPQIFWTPAPLNAKSWADVDDDDDDDYFATTAPPRPVWDSSNHPDKEPVGVIEEESESEDDGLDLGDDEVDEEPDHEPEAQHEPIEAVKKPPLPPISKDAERQLSKKELKKKELAELDAVLAELGISNAPSSAPTQLEVAPLGSVVEEKKTEVAVDSRASKKKKKKDKDKEKEKEEEQPLEEAQDVPRVTVEKLKKLATSKKKKSAKEMDSAAKAAAVEAAARTAKLAAAKKKEKNHYNQQPVR